MFKKSNLFSIINLFLFIFLVLSTFSGQIVSAEGDGTGGGRNEPLTLVSSSIQNGEIGVSLKPEIKLTFSKNIVNMTVSDNNKKCFSLIDESGKTIPINVIFVDDQIDYEGRNDALIIPKENLAQGTTYSLVISSVLTSKSGVTLGKEIRITFTTQGSKPVPTNTDANNNSTLPNTQTSIKSAPNTITSTAKASNNVETSNSTKVEDNSQEAENQNTDDEQQNNSSSQENKTKVSEKKKDQPVPYTAAKTTNKKTDKKQTNDTNTPMIMLGIIVIAIIAGWIIYFYRRKKLVK